MKKLIQKPIIRSLIGLSLLAISYSCSKNSEPTKDDSEIPPSNSFQDQSNTPATGKITSPPTNSTPSEETNSSSIDNSYSLREELSSEEREFFARLSETSQYIFCRVLTPEQRKDAIVLTKTAFFIKRRSCAQTSYLQVFVDPNSAVEKIFSQINSATKES